MTRWKAMVVVTAVSLAGGTALIDACGGEQDRLPLKMPLSAVLDCTGAYEVTAMFPPSPVDAAADSAPNLVNLSLTGAGFANGGPDSGPAFSDSRTRHRAAVVCACRARRNRERSNVASAWADGLAVVGGVGTVGGGVLNGVSGTGVDDTTRKTLLTSGLISLGVGTLAFGTIQALALAKSSGAFASSAADQEYAAAVLWEDSATEAQWDNAWAACVTAEGSDKPLLPTNPATAFAFEAGTPSDAPSGASDSSGDAKHTTDLVHTVPTTGVDGGH